MSLFIMGSTLRRYFLREVAVPFCFGIGIFTFILLIARMLKLVELVVNRGVSLLEIGAKTVSGWPSCRHSHSAMDGPTQYRQ